MKLYSRLHHFSKNKFRNWDYHNLALFTHVREMYTYSYMYVAHEKLLQLIFSYWLPVSRNPSQLTGWLEWFETSWRMFMGQIEWLRWIMLS